MIATKSNKQFCETGGSYLKQGPRKEFCVTGAGMENSTPDQKTQYASHFNCLQNSRYIM